MQRRGGGEIPSWGRSRPDGSVDTAVRCECMCAVCGGVGVRVGGMGQGLPGSCQGAGPSSPGWATCLPRCLLPSSLSASSGCGARSWAPWASGV